MGSLPRNCSQIGKPLVDLVLALFIAAFLSYTPFLNGRDNPNTASRIALTLSIVERGELTIDPLQALTSDKAFFAGHYISDKAPGMSFSALPVAFLSDRLFKMLRPGFQWTVLEGGRVKFSREVSYLIYYATLSTSSLFTAAAIVALFLAAWRLGASVGGALFAALAYGFGTPTWGWATAFFGHAMSGAMLVLAFAGIVWLVPRPGEKPAPLRLKIAAFAVGFVLAWAVVTEYPAGPATIVIGLFALWRLRAIDRLLWLHVVGMAMVGGLVGILPLLAYNLELFGSPFELAYGHMVGFEGGKEGFFRIGLPSSEVLYEILIGGRRGLLWLTPLLLLFPFAAISLLRNGDQATGWLVVAITVSYITINAGYFYWDGGWSTGPRYLTAALPFLCLPFAWLWTYGSFILRSAISALLAASMALAFVAASVGMMAPSDAGPNVLLDYLLPSFFDGNLRAAIFTRFGLLGYLVVFPLGLAWGVVGVLLLRVLTTLPKNAQVPNIAQVKENRTS